MTETLYGSKRSCCTLQTVLNVSKTKVIEIMLYVGINKRNINETKRNNDWVMWD